VTKPQERIPVTLTIAIVLTVAVVLGQVFGHYSDIKDIVTGQFNRGIRLHYPITYLFFAPFFQVADHLTILSTRQHIAFNSAVNLFWIGVRFLKLFGSPISIRLFLVEVGKVLLLNLAVFLVFVVAVLVPRPMARLELDDKNLLAFNIHSHTHASGDGRSSFSPLKNLLWHERAGFHANFITDHNVIHGSLEGREISLNRKPKPGMISMRGEEVSLFRSHWILLGNRTLLEKEQYDTGYRGIKPFLRKVSQEEDQIVIASLPQYWQDHWDDLEEFLAWGIQGFEIVTSSPRALDFQPRLRARIVKLSRENNLLMVGGSDSHGWGSTVYVWNLVRFPNWRGIPPERLEEELIQLMRQKRFNAVQVVVRVKAESPDHPWMLVVDPLLQIWEGARSLPFSQAVTILLWIWVPLALPKLIRKISGHSVVG
jgi:hypothetical protein